MRSIAVFIAALSLSAMASSATAAPPCKDAKGKFIKCPPPKPVRCKDAKGKFAACTAPGAKPI
jgi:hypothetical protein